MRINKTLASLFFTLTCLVFAKITVYADTPHTVVKGDTLTSIAATHCGDASRWKEIYNLNLDKIKDPNILSIGWVLGLPEDKKKIPKEVSVSRGSPTSSDILENVRATAYDLSVASCGKRPTHPGYGQTRSGRQIDGLTRVEAACVAVDPRVIPLGSILYVTFDDPEHIQYSGVYQALDTGGAIKGRSIDVFLGDFNSTKEDPEVTNFGVAKARVVIIKKGW